MIYGYARVSTKGQARDGNSLDDQKLRLSENGATRLFVESYTGTKLHRPELDKLLEVIKKGDMIIVTKLDRIARNTKDGIAIIDTITDKGCAIRILNMGMFDNTPTGRLMKNVMLAFAEFERDMIVQRTTEGKIMAKENNPDFKQGRPMVGNDNPEEILRQFRLHLYEGKTIRQICSELGYHNVQTWYNRLKQFNIGQWDSQKGGYKEGSKW